MVYELIGQSVHYDAVKPHKPTHTAIEIAADEIPVLIAIPAIPPFNNWKVVQIEEKLGRLDTEDTMCVK